MLLATMWALCGDCRSSKSISNNSRSKRTDTVGHTTCGGWFADLLAGHGGNYEHLFSYFPSSSQINQIGLSKLEITATGFERPI